MFAVPKPGKTVRNRACVYLVIT